MFDQVLTMETGTRRPWTVFAGLSGQLLALGAAMLLPLVYTDKLPSFRVIDLHILPPVNRVMPPPVSSESTPRPSASKKPVFLDPSKLYAYRRIPAVIPDIVDSPALTPGTFVPGAVFDPRGIVSSLPAGIGALPAPPEPKPAAPAQSAGAVPAVPRIKVGGVVQAAKLVKRVIPAYPPLARQARVSGTVRLLGIIGRDGTVQQLQVLSGHPLLSGAALDAVRQWIYRPTLLNGEPAEVVAPIDVHFTLSQ